MLCCNCDGQSYSGAPLYPPPLVVACCQSRRGTFSDIILIYDSIVLFCRKFSTRVQNNDVQRLIWIPSLHKCILFSMSIFSENLWDPSLPCCVLHGLEVKNMWRAWRATNTIRFVKILLLVSWNCEHIGKNNTIGAIDRTTIYAHCCL